MIPIPSPATINVITNIVGLLLVVFGAVQTYLTSQQFNWMTFGLCIGGAVIAYFTGKSGVRTEKMLKAKGIILDPKKKGILPIDISNAVLGPEITAFFSTGIFLTTDEGKAVLDSIKKAVASEKGKILIEQFGKLGEKTSNYEELYFKKEAVK